MHLGHALEVDFTHQGWGLLVRRTDFAPHERFFDLHGKPIGPRDLEAYLPNWRKLEWTPLAPHVFARAESRAADRDFEVYVRAANGSARTHQQVVDAFIEFMSE